MGKQLYIPEESSYFIFKSKRKRKSYAKKGILFTSAPYNFAIFSVYTAMKSKE